MLKANLTYIFGLISLFAVLHVFISLIFHNFAPYYLYPLLLPHEDGRRSFSEVVGKRSDTEAQEYINRTYYFLENRTIFSCANGYTLAADVNSCVTTPGWKALFRDKIYTYSGHIDPRDNTQDVIRIFGASRDHSELGSLYQDLLCHVLSDNGKLLSRSKARLHISGTPKTYRSTQIECAVQKNLSASFLLVGLAMGEFDLPDYFLRVQRSKNAASDKGGKINITKPFNFTVCLWSPLYNFTDFRTLVEWIEVNRLFGAQNFVIYNESIGRDVDSYLQYYKQRQIVQVLPWNLPPEFLANNNEDILYHLQGLLISDCHYRNLMNTQFLVGLDVDEIIVPKSSTATTWADVIREANCSADVPAYAARHVYFGRNWTPDERFNNDSLVKDKLKLFTLLNTLYSQRLYPYPNRTKLFVRPDMVSSIGVHDLGQGHACVIDLSIGALHHYRHTDLRKFRQSKGVGYDNAMHKYMYDVIKRTSQVHHTVNMTL